MRMRGQLSIDMSAVFPVIPTRARIVRAKPPTPRAMRLGVRRCTRYLRASLGLSKAMSRARKWIEAVDRIFSASREAMRRSCTLLDVKLTEHETTDIAAYLLTTVLAAE